MIHALILTGQNNHDWARSSPYCKDLMEKTGKFKVDITVDPSKTLEDALGLKRYQLFFVDYNGPMWSDLAKKNFVDAVRNGTGVVILHAANNAFTGWTEYEEICALLWRQGTSHGQYHKFDIRITDPNHPITKGLPPVLAQHPDELYHRMVHMHNTPYQTLAVAYSDPATNGTGNDEPVMICKTYGKGRVFHHILGHVWSGGGMDSFDSSAFQRTILRGAEWAATGNVTID